MTRAEQIRREVEGLLMARGFERQPIGKPEPTIFDIHPETYWALPGDFSKGSRTVINRRTGEPAEVPSFQGTTISVIDVWPRGGRAVSVRIMVFGWSRGGCAYWGKPMSTTWSTTRISNEIAKAINTYQNC